MTERMIRRWETLPQSSTVSDLLDWCHERGLDPDTLKFSGTIHFRWESPETEKERATREEWERKREEKQRGWDRRKYAELWERYGGVAPDQIPEEQP